MKDGSKSEYSFKAKIKIPDGNKKKTDEPKPPTVPMISASKASIKKL
jgi:hypothetical protein